MKHKLLIRRIIYYYQLNLRIKSKCMRVLNSFLMLKSQLRKSIQSNKLYIKYLKEHLKEFRIFLKKNIHNEEFLSKYFNIFCQALYWLDLNSFCFKKLRKYDASKIIIKFPKNYEKMFENCVVKILIKYYPITRDSSRCFEIKKFLNSHTHRTIILQEVEKLFYNFYFDLK